MMDGLGAFIMVIIVMAGTALFILGEDHATKNIVKACDTFNVVLLPTKSGEEIYVCAKRATVQDKSI